ncbi:MAG: hypothetical protein L0227_00700, partial [Chloroflexi bacterium]|nr:hypothetical protein [Chloroflexota bacterium]
VALSGLTPWQTYRRLLRAGLSAEQAGALVAYIVGLAARTPYEVPIVYSIREIEGLGFLRWIAARDHLD